MKKTKFRCPKRSRALVNGHDHLEPHSLQHFAIDWLGFLARSEANIISFQSSLTTDNNQDIQSCTNCQSDKHLKWTLPTHPRPTS